MASEEPTGLEMIAAEIEDLGPCCICEGTEAVHNVLLLPMRCPLPGRGWGCVVCHLPADGAAAVICEGCFNAYQQTASEPLREMVKALRFACRGYPGTEGRVPFASLTGRFEHDEAIHEAEADYVRNLQDAMDDADEDS